MTQESYQTIFELGYSSFPWASVARPVVFVAIELLLAWLFRKKMFYFIFGGFVASMASIMLLTSMVVLVPHFVECHSAYVSGKSIVVDGVVENFHPAPAIGPAAESFTVRGILFSYNKLDYSPCFHNAPLRGGPIRDGLHVRIHYNDECIQRVELRAEPNVTPP